MLTCCWVHQPQDAILATAGTDKLIHILSLARSKELVRLGGHTRKRSQDTHFIFILFFASGMKKTEDNIWRTKIN